MKDSLFFLLCSIISFIIHITFPKKSEGEFTRADISRYFSLICGIFFLIIAVIEFFKALQ